MSVGIVDNAWRVARGAWCVVRGAWCTSYRPPRRVQERALSMIQRSIMVGSLLVLVGGVVGWQITKWCVWASQGSGSG